MRENQVVTRPKTPLDPRHRPLTLRLLLESVGVFAALAALTLWADHAGANRLVVGLCVFAQGCWFHRLYVVAHEASHRKLWPEHRGINDAIGQLLLLPLMLPLRIHRKIHAFHHGQNRRDHHTSAIDTFVLKRPASKLARLRCHVLWFIAVFAGGWFIHSLISVLLFLAMPLSVARRISPAFRGWTGRDQLLSMAAFAVGVGVHLGVAKLGGARVWGLCLGAPLLAFAWVYSLLVYIYHYDTSYGPQVRFHVRSLRPNRVASWWLLNFNEHATHHRMPKLPWYQLPEHRQPMPNAFADNQKVETILGAILYQLRGARIIEVDET
ncbi:fatty acid desaturase family protein [Plesiocystis pacifica SIR-1]|uniref:Fatty acid desaturase family protein n=1 Tax=Plesiocystis pacifica SIR-1 TaxID=391625 RepID=A6GE09_9BACT|nr:fatty acid desaturase family protein [Plesiocystis pacifica SIR-1]